MQIFAEMTILLSSTVR